MEQERSIQGTKQSVEENDEFYQYIPSERASRQSKIINQEHMSSLCVRIEENKSQEREKNNEQGIVSDLIHLGLIGLDVGEVVREQYGFLFNTLNLDPRELNIFQKVSQKRAKSKSVESERTYTIKVPRIENEDTIAYSYLACAKAGLALAQFVQEIDREKNTNEHIRQNKPESKGEIFLEDLIRTSKEKKNVLVVGAGGTGTYTCLSALLAGYSVTVVDFDAIETSNLNRQVFYAGHEGEHKANVLERRLSSLGQIKGLVSRIEDARCNLEDFDYVFSCVDNTATRRYLDEICSRKQELGRVVLIDTGTGPFNGRVHVAKSKRLFDQIMLAPDAKSSCIQAEPSIIMPNMIVGSLALQRAVDGLEKPLLYKGKKVGIYGQ